jgi:hypothetical protein
LVPRGSLPIRADITAGEEENPGPRPLIVITGLDPVIYLGTHIVRREMAGSSPAMTLRGWRNTVRASPRLMLAPMGSLPVGLAIPPRR